jgi:putative transposase
MYPYGIGFEGLVLYRSTNVKEYLLSLLMKLLYRHIGSQRFWLWFCIEPVYSSVLGIYISEERNMIVAEKFIRSLVEKYGKHIVYTDGGTWYDDEACKVIGLKHYLHSPLEKSLIERVMQYFKDRTECFDDYYPCSNSSKRRDCNNSHVYNWIELFVSCTIILE